MIKSTVAEPKLQYIKRTFVTYDFELAAPPFVTVACMSKR